MSRAPVRTLVVHRHPATRERLAEVARDRGHDVGAAASLDETKAAMAGTEVLLVEWAGSLSPGRGPRPVVIAVLEPSTAANAERALRAGADDCIDAGEAASNVAVRLACAERRLDDLRDRGTADDDVRRLHKAVATMQVGVTITDLAGRVVYANPAEAEMHGYSVADYVGQPGRALSPRDEWRPLTPEQLRGMRKWSRERIRHRRDGSSFPVHLLSDVVTDAAGDPVGIVTVCEDITERRRAEEAETASRAEHAQLEEQLRQSQKMEAIGKLAGGVAHDFNNLLMVVLGFADQLLQQLEPSDPRRRCVEPIVSAAEKGAMLTRQLLAVSRRDPVQPRVLDLNGTVRDMDRLLERLIGDDVEVATSVCAEPCLVRMDPGHAEQVLLNLLVNARDAMPSGGRLMVETRRVAVDEREARLHPDLQAGPHVMLVVTDTGVGMPREVLRHVFEPFFTTKVAGQGTGFGLATVYGIVRQAGGSIAVDSEPGRGACFRIHLPEAQGPVDEVSDRERPAGA